MRSEPLPCKVRGHRLLIVNEAKEVSGSIMTTLTSVFASAVCFGHTRTAAAANAVYALLPAA